MRKIALCLIVFAILWLGFAGSDASCTGEKESACQNHGKVNVWMDCDPGLDDVIAIIFAAKNKIMNLIGLSTSGGNTSLNSATKNACDILHNCGRDDVPVVKGSSRLLHGQPKYAEEIHGEGGIGGVVIPSSPRKAIEENNFHVIAQSIMGSKKKVTWANTGALTNLCFLLKTFPKVKNNIERIVIMGGAIGKGNMSPAAEFNIGFDPAAFECVLEEKGSIPLVMVPLEVTHEVRAREKIFEFLKKYDHVPFAKAIRQMLEAFKEMYFKYENFDFPPIHDACVINYILHPEDFELKKAKIVVDTGKVSYGRTNCYFHDLNDPLKEIDSIDRVAVRMNNRSKFWERMTSIFEQIFKSTKQ